MTTALDATGAKRWRSSRHAAATQPTLCCLYTHTSEKAQVFHNTHSTQTTHNPCAICTLMRAVLIQARANSKRCEHPAPQVRSVVRVCTRVSVSRRKLTLQCRNHQPLWLSGSPGHHPR